MGVEWRKVVPTVGLSGMVIVGGAALLNATFNGSEKPITTQLSGVVSVYKSRCLDPRLDASQRINISYPIGSRFGIGTNDGFQVVTEGITRTSQADKVVVTYGTSGRYYFIVPTGELTWTVTGKPSEDGKVIVSMDPCGMPMLDTSEVVSRSLLGATMQIQPINATVTPEVATTGSAELNCPDNVLPGSNYFMLKNGNTLVDGGVLRYGMKVNKTPVDVVYKGKDEKACVGVTSRRIKIGFVLAADGTILSK